MKKSTLVVLEEGSDSAKAPFAGCCFMMMMPFSNR